MKQASLDPAPTILSNAELCQQSPNEKKIIFFSRQKSPNTVFFLYLPVTVSQKNGHYRGGVEALR